jgi:hypothetical protein
MADKPRRIRPYHQSGLYAQKPPVPAHQHAAADLKAQLIADQGGEDEVSAAKMILIDAIVTATLKSRVVHSYLATIERPWCDRRSNKVWRVVLDAARLEQHLVNLLSLLGLERVPAPVESLEAYIVRKAAEKATATNGDAAGSRLEPDTATQPAEVGPMPSRDAARPCWRLAGSGPVQPSTSLAMSPRIATAADALPPTTA